MHFFQISYDVFMPSKFTSKKGSAAASKVPDYRVVVCSPIGVEGHSAVLPSFDEIAQVCWSPTQFLSLDLSQLSIKIGVKKCVFQKSHNQGLHQLYLTVSWDLCA